MLQYVKNNAGIFRRPQQFATSSKRSTEQLEKCFVLMYQKLEKWVQGCHFNKIFLPYETLQYPVTFPRPRKSLAFKKTISASCLYCFIFLDTRGRKLTTWLTITSSLNDRYCKLATVRRIFILALINLIQRHLAEMLNKPRQTILFLRNITIL